MKQLILSLFLLSATALNAQVGVNTNDPKTTLDVVGTPSDATIPDGIIAPRISREKLILKTSYTTAQTGAIVYVSDLSGTTNTATAKVTAIGYYYFNGTVWNSMNASVSQFSYGDIKTGVQTADHQGWVKLDGRATTSLTSTQQAQATALGIGVNLPNATNSVLMQNGTALGSVSGSNSRTIAQNQLPNLSLNWSHSHGNASGNFIVDGAGGSGSANIAGGTGWRLINQTTSAGSTWYLNGNVTQQALDITPRSLSVNTFIYLGN